MINNREKLEENIKTLITLLESKDVKVRKKARLTLIAKRKYSVPFLISALQHSENAKVRWEIAKAFGGIYDVRAIPELINALDNGASDVAWLAGEALKKYKKVAWKELLGAIIERGTESVMLRRGAHHVLRNQKEEGFNDLLASLQKSLLSSTSPENARLMAYKISQKMCE